MWTMVGKPREVEDGGGSGVAERRYGGGNVVAINCTAQDAEDEVLVRAINKAPVLQINKDVEVDQAAVSARDSFTTYGTPHKAATTVLYTIPVQGWAPSNEAQQRRLQLLKHDYHMPRLSPEQVALNQRRLDNSRIPTVTPRSARGVPKSISKRSLPRIES